MLCLTKAIVSTKQLFLHLHVNPQCIISNSNSNLFLVTSQQKFTNIHTILHKFKENLFSRKPLNGLSEKNALF